MKPIPAYSWTGGKTSAPKYDKFIPIFNILKFAVIFR